MQPLSNSSIIIDNKLSMFKRIEISEARFAKIEAGEYVDYYSY